MRFLLAGFLILVLPVAAFAQAKGQVLSIGFNNIYRPDCWTPMLIQLTSGSQDSMTYQIQVHQEDLDRDRVLYTQQVTLGGNEEGKPATTEEFWVYFLPKPTGDGLPDALQSGSSLAELGQQLKVYLCTADGKKQLSVLPLTATIESVDPKRAHEDESRSRKLVLFISDGNDHPIVPDYSHLRGVMEDVEPVPLKPQDLPNNVIGYDGVDTIVWMDADANALVQGTRTPTLEAIQQWVDQGGHLVITEPAESMKIKPFANLLPVGGLVNGAWAIPMVDRSDVDILRRLSKNTGSLNDWNVKGTFKVGRAPVVAGAKVDEWMPWTGDDNVIYYSPWLARRGVGLGVVTWVAQDLGSPGLTDYGKTGWRYIWDRVFDWRNSQRFGDDLPPPTDGTDPWQPSTGVDLGAPLMNGMDLTNAAAALISIACVFFFLYWLIAGPGVYLFLASRKKSHQSWFYFGVSALVATGLTALLVKAVVRGPPKLAHVSLVRYAAGDADELIESRFGLYIPQDGDKQIDLLQTDPNRVSYISPFEKHPQYVADDDSFPAYKEYDIPVRDDSDASPVSVTIPYRSTSKKLQVQWLGDPTMKIQTPDGAPDVKVVPPQRGAKFLDGTLENRTGMDLQNVFLIFKAPHGVDDSGESANDDTWMIRAPYWPKDAPLKMSELTAAENRINPDNPKARKPDDEKMYAFGTIGLQGDWDRFWQPKADHVGDDMELALPMLTGFDQIYPWEIDRTNSLSRFEFYRRGARLFNLSPAISAGELVICGLGAVDSDTSKTPLPVPLNVSDAPVTGAGTTIVQFVLPLDRSAVTHAPATRPAPTPPANAAAKPATGE